MDIGSSWLIGGCSYNLNKPSDSKSIAEKSSTVQRHNREFSRWLELRKKRNPWVFECENSLRWGTGQSLSDHIALWKHSFGRLSSFLAVKKHQREANGEMDRIIESMFNMVGGTSSKPVPAGESVYIVLGDAGFDVGRGCHTTFENRFVSKAKSLGYTILYADEYYTSQVCPCCDRKCKSKGMRVKYCQHCDLHFHRDIMAAENMCCIGESGLRNLHRPFGLCSPDQQQEYMRNGNAFTSHVRFVLFLFAAY